jgi:hypothetical protein
MTKKNMPKTIGFLENLKIPPVIKVDSSLGNSIRKLGVF